jgi:hypothetical protein
MKLTALRWFTVPLLGLLLASHASAASLDDEAKQVVMDYLVVHSMSGFFSKTSYKRC